MDSVFDGGAQAVIDGGAEFNAVFEIVNGLFEIVIAGIVRIGVEVGKDQRDIDQSCSCVFQWSVVKAREWQMQFSEFLPDAPARFFVDDCRCQIASVDFFDLSDFFSAEDLNCFFLSRSFFGMKSVCFFRFWFSILYFLENANLK